jgi:hypothetical protein
VPLLAALAGEEVSGTSPLQRRVSTRTLVLKRDWRNSVVSGRVNQLKSKGSLAIVPARGGSPTWAASTHGPCRHGPPRMVGSRMCARLRASGPSGAGRAEEFNFSFTSGLELIL